MIEDKKAKDRREETKEENEEIRRYISGLRRYTEKGIPVYMDGELSGPAEWEKLFEIREDGMFYMGDYVQADAGGLKEIRFDRVYLSENEAQNQKERADEKGRGKT